MKTLTLFLESGSWFRNAYKGTSKEQRMHEVLERPDIKRAVVFVDRREITILVDELTAGRDSRRNEIVLDDEVASRTHCRFFLKKGLFGRRWCLEDLGSAKGTVVNGRQLQPRKKHSLRNGDEIRIGRTVLIAEKKPMSAAGDEMQPIAR